MQCRRCNGSGEVTYRVGLPGQDRRMIRYADIKWREPSTVRCPICLGLGVENTKPEWKPHTEAWKMEPLTDEDIEALPEVPPDDRPND